MSQDMNEDSKNQSSGSTAPLPSDHEDNQQREAISLQAGTAPFTAPPPATSFPAPLPTPAYRAAPISGGLYGDAGVPTSLPPMPKLAGSTVAQYTDWKNKALCYFQTNGLNEVATMKPVDSLQLAIDLDGGCRSELQIRALWLRLHTKAAGVIKQATESVLGTSLFDSIESRYDSSYLTDAYTQPMRMWISRFTFGNAYHLWTSIQSKLEKYTPHDLSRLVDRYMSLRYSPRSDPNQFRKEFEDSVRELKLAGLELPEKLHMSVWFRALPPEYEALRQGLGARPDITWIDIYNAIVNQYSANSRKPAKPNQEADHAAFINEAAAKQGGKPKRAKEQDKPSMNAGDGKKKCSYCQRKGHTVNECLQLKRAQARISTAVAGNQNQCSEDEHTAPFIEDDVIKALSNSAKTEYVNVANESATDEPIHFIFDSGATTHLTHVRRVVDALQDSPEMIMSSAIKGRRTIINKRGKVRLNDKWTLRDVVYVPSASTNLISEGRLVDAGYAIHKTKQFILVRDSDGKVVLRGVRFNRLWILTVNGKTPSVRPLNTLVPTKPPAEPNSEPEEKKEDQPGTRRPIPKRNSRASAASNAAPKSQ
jgi:hypothetical protein